MPGYASLSGLITDTSGKPVSGARVVVEPGIEATLIAGRVDETGRFSFDGDFFGTVGIVAWAPGYGFGGTHLNIASGDQPDNIPITLAPEAVISGQVTDAQGTPISNARLASLAVTHPFKVGIPLFKLEPFGVVPPVTNSEGRFSVSGVPADGEVILKFEHPAYAQEAVPNVKAGESALRVTMHRGVALRGTVNIRGVGAPVSGALVAARNAQPPHDTAFSTTDGSGVFTTLLKPGVYLLQAYATGRISPGLQRVTLRGDLPEQHANLTLSQKGMVLGTIHDAKSGAPIAGARVLLETQDQPAGATRTGSDGRFKLEAPEGVNTLYFESVEGYRPPDTRAMRITVPGGGELELPGLWLAPMPDHVLHIVEADGETPVPNAFISLLWPRQFGWQRSNSLGQVEVRFGALPPDNRILGFVEHPEKSLGALFVLDQQRTEEASVALLPLAEVSGQVVGKDGTPIEGVTVGALYADDTSPEALTLWRAVTDGSGRFVWPAAPAGVPQRCIATLGNIHGTAGRDINPAPGEQVELGVIRLEVIGAAPVNSVSEYWTEPPRLCGPAASLDKSSGMVVVCCKAADAAVCIDAAVAMCGHLTAMNLGTAVLVDGIFECHEAAVPVYAGTGYPDGVRVYDRNGRLCFQSVGLPPVKVLRRLAVE